MATKVYYFLQFNEKLQLEFCKKLDLAIFINDNVLWGIMYPRNRLNFPV